MPVVTATRDAGPEGQHSGVNGSGARAPVNLPDVHVGRSGSVCGSPPPACDSKIRIAVDMHEHEQSGAKIGAWFFKVEASAFYTKTKVGRFRAWLAKRECIRPVPGETKAVNFRGALKVTHPDLCVLFEEPLVFFTPSGMPGDQFETFSNALCVYDDFKHYRVSTGDDKRGKDHQMHPGYRAWVLVIDDVFVDERYRGCGIGESMVRESLSKVERMADEADRPLLAFAQPPLLRDIPTSDLLHPEGHRRIHLKTKTAEAFWRSAGFKRYEPAAFLGQYQWAWYFWGKRCPLPRERDIKIPEDAEQNTPEPPRRSKGSPRKRPMLEKSRQMPSPGAQASMDESLVDNFDDTMSKMLENGDTERSQGHSRSNGNGSGRDSPRPEPRVSSEVPRLFGVFRVVPQAPMPIPGNAEEHSSSDDSPGHDSDEFDSDG